MYLNANANISACKPHFLHNSVFCNSLEIFWHLNTGSEAAMALVHNIPKTGNTMTAEPVPQAVQVFTCPEMHLDFNLLVCIDGFELNVAMTTG